MKDQKRTWSLLIVILVILILNTYVYQKFSKSKNSSLNDYNEDLKSISSDVLVDGENDSQKPISNEFVKSEYIPVDYSYLFEEEKNSTYSNIVGYFAGGSFVWYVPGWLANNWTMSKEVENQDDIVFVPKIRKNTDFSDIVFKVGNSSEIFNALFLYENEIKSINPGDLIINEVLLNKHADGTVSLLIEANTRIYHVQKVIFDRIKDTYYLDGSGKTLVITFDSKKEIFQQFSSKIRDMVEGIGEHKQPQG